MEFRTASPSSIFFSRTRAIFVMPSLAVLILLPLFLPLIVLLLVLALSFFALAVSAEVVLFWFTLPFLALVFPTDILLRLYVLFLFSIPFLSLKLYFIRDSFLAEVASSRVILILFRKLLLDLSRN